MLVCVNVSLTMSQTNPEGNSSTMEANGTNIDHTHTRDVLSLSALTLWWRRSGQVVDETVVLGNGSTGILDHLTGQVSRERTGLCKVCEAAAGHGTSLRWEDLGQHELLSGPAEKRVTRASIIVSCAQHSVAILIINQWLPPWIASL